MKQPGDWRSCGYGELAGARQQNSLPDVNGLVEFFELPNQKALAEMHSRRIAQEMSAKD